MPECGVYAHNLAMRFLLALVLMATPAIAEDWRTYTNPRYGFSVDVPAEGWVEQPDTEQGNGRSWLSADGRSGLMAWGGHVSGGAFQSEVESGLATNVEIGWIVTDRKDENLNQSSLGPSSMTYSAVWEDRILHMRSVASCGGAHGVHVRIEFPKDQQDLHRQTLTRIMNSLSPNPGINCAK